MFSFVGSLVGAGLLATAVGASAACAPLPLEAPWQSLSSVSASWAQLPAQAAWLGARHVRVPVRLADPQVRQWVWLSGSDLPTTLERGKPVPADVLVVPLESVSSEQLTDPAAAEAWRLTSSLGESWAFRLGTVSEATLRERLGLPQVVAALDRDGKVLQSTRLQQALAIDALRIPPEDQALGAEILRRQGSRMDVRWSVWAPTARAAWLCLEADASGGRPAQAIPLQLHDATGVWSTTVSRLRPGATYTYAVEVFVPSQGWVRNRVTDPYSVSLTADSQRSAVLDLNDPSVQPRGWRQRPRPAAPESPVDMVISELHVRDFSVFDPQVPPAWRGKYLAFTHPRAQGVRHLRSLAQAGLRDVHLLPIFDWATAPETDCLMPNPAQQAQWRKARGDHAAAADWVRRHASADCFNWGYDPWHFNAPEGSFATDARDPAVRVRELRAMVMALQGMGLRVGMDVVYNHMSAAGQHPKAVLDRLVPGYYHRLNAQGAVERSTCCDNTATEHRMMRRLMIDSAVHWVRHFGIDSFRFDLMGHQPREAMVALQKAVDRAAGRFIPLLGEGWNFGEIANGARFVQAAQGDLNGTGIGTFNDRLRDAARGTRHGDDMATTVARRGWLTGASDAERAELADAVRAGLAGSVASLRLKGRDGEIRRLADRRMGDQALGYVSEPTEVVNYVENHDNPTLFDLLAFKLPLNTPAQHRAERQVLGGALVLLAQGVPYLHAGQEILRSKSLDLNSYDSGDWFNGMDWSLASHGFGRGLPPGQENAAFAAVTAPRLADPQLRMDPSTLAWSLGAHLDLLRVRSQTPLLRLRTAEALRHRVRPLYLTPGADPSVVLMWWDGLVPGPGFDPASPHAGVLVALNAADQAHTVEVQELQQLALQLHPVFQAPKATDRRLRTEAQWRADEAQLSLPPRSASVWVLPANSAASAPSAPK